MCYAICRMLKTVGFIIYYLEPCRIIPYHTMYVYTHELNQIIIHHAAYW